MICVWTLFVIAVLPVLFHWSAHPIAVGSARSVRVGLANLVALLICFAIYRAERPCLGRARAFALVFLVLVLSALGNYMHKVTVDHGVNYFTNMTNLQWQVWMHNGAITFSPVTLPHTYRFLPNAIVRWMEIGGLSFEAARNFYRFFFGLLIFYALYRYALLYTNYLGAIIAMLVTATIYPISFSGYAGQLTDPASHLSFLLCFIALEIDDFGWFLTAMLIGSLAKEAVLAMTGYYLLFRRGDKHYWSRSLAAVVSCVVAFLGVRILVLHGLLHYNQISNTTLSIISVNWHDPHWPPPFLLTFCALLPFLPLAWKQTPLELKRLTLYLLPVLFISSMLFSFLSETRNYMPAIFVLSIITGDYLSRQFIDQPECPTPCPELVEGSRAVRDPGN